MNANPTKAPAALLALCGLTVIAASCSLSMDSTDGTAGPAGSPAALEGVGRFEMNSVGNNLFVLDTVTGKHWQKFINPSGGPAVFTEFVSPWAARQSDPIE